MKRAIERCGARPARAGEEQPATRVVPLYQAQTVARAVLPEPATTLYPASVREALLAPERTQPGTARVAKRALLLRLALAAAACALLAAAWLAPGSSDHGTHSVQQRRARPRTPARATPADAPAAAAAAETRGPLSTSDTDGRRQPAHPEPRTPHTPRAAAEHLARGRYTEALQAYRGLSQALPEMGVYAEIAAIIERRLALRCQQRTEPREAGCPDVDR